MNNPDSAIINILVRRLAKVDGFDILCGVDVTKSTNPRIRRYLSLAQTAYEVLVLFKC